MVGCHRCSGFAASLLDGIELDTIQAVGGATPVNANFPVDIQGAVGDTAPWSVTINGSFVAINAITQVNSNTLALQLASPPSAGDVVTATYTPPPYPLEGLGQSPPKVIASSATAAAV